MVLPWRTRLSIYVSQLASSPLQPRRWMDRRLIDLTESSLGAMIWQESGDVERVHMIDAFTHALLSNEIPSPWEDKRRLSAYPQASGHPQLRGSLRTVLCAT